MKLKKATTTLFLLFSLLTYPDWGYSQMCELRNLHDDLTTIEVEFEEIVNTEKGFNTWQHLFRQSIWTID